VKAASVLEARGISKSFHGAKALDGVGLHLRTGEIHALMGENGAGKSTLIKVLSGIYSPDSGEIALHGSKVQPKSNHEAQNFGISTVFQEVNLVSTLSVAENIFLGREPRRFGCIDWKAMEAGAKRALARLSLDIDVTLALEDFPIAIQQMTAIARALDQNAKVLILDEATSSLDRDEVSTLFSVLRKLKAQGLSILFVSHFLDQIYEISDRISVLRNGQFVGEWLTSELGRVTLISKMMGRELAQMEAATSTSNPISQTKKTWLKCEGLEKTGTIEAFDLELHEGEKLGLAGLLGSGRTEIARLLFGLDRSTGGKLQIDGKEVSFTEPADAIEHGFALVPEDRKLESIFPQLSVRENIVLALQTQRGWASSLSLKRQNEIADRFIKALGIRTRDAEQPIETLSGGNQQKAILARWLALEPRLLILDEPTRGIDVGAKAEILKLILELSEKGKSVLMVSSELEEVIRVSDRVAVLRDRKVVAEIPKADLSETSIMTAIGEAR
jgi:monosaccharide-transporting ATPase